MVDMCVTPAGQKRLTRMQNDGSLRQIPEPKGFWEKSDYQMAGIKPGDYTFEYQNYINARNPVTGITEKTPFRVREAAGVLEVPTEVLSKSFLFPNKNTGETLINADKRLQHNFIIVPKEWVKNRPICK